MVTHGSWRVNISMHILLTVLCTFLKVLTRRICLTIKSFFTWWSFPLFSWPYCLIQGWYCEENLDSSHSHLYLSDKFLLIQVFINDIDFNHHNYLTFYDTNMILVNFFQQAIFLGVGSFEPVISVLNFEVRCSENLLDDSYS